MAEGAEGSRGGQRGVGGGGRGGAEGGCQRVAEDHSYTLMHSRVLTHTHTSSQSL